LIVFVSDVGPPEDDKPRGQVLRTDGRRPPRVHGARRGRARRGAAAAAARGLVPRRQVLARLHVDVVPEQGDVLVGAGARRAHQAGAGHEAQRGAEDAVAQLALGQWLRVGRPRPPGLQDQLHDHRRREP